MGGATRFTTLLTVPMPPMRPRRSLIILRRRLSAISVAPRRLLTLSSPSETKPQIPHPVKSLHSQSSSTAYMVHSSAAQHHQNHPWPEWTRFLNILSSGREFFVPEDHGTPPEDAFVLYEELSDDFVRSAAACIAFAHARPNLLGLLSRRDMEAIVSNGTPFLFKSALDAARRMKTFLGTGETNLSERDRANTIDLMKYVLSYASNPATVSSDRKGLYSRELVDSSVRNLLHELGTMITEVVPTGCVPVSRQTQKPYGQHIEMKRGDWICPKCNFMNFAKNMKCLECEGPRPERQLTGSEWDCPQCNFFNYGRNLACLRCDCRRPASFTSSKLSGNEWNAQQWFTKISRPNSINTTTNVTLNERSNPIGHPQFSETKTGSFQKQEMEVQAKKPERWFEKMSELHDVKDVAGKNNDRPITLPTNKRQASTGQANGTDSVPFVPFPPGYFARKDNNTDQSHMIKEDDSKPINVEDSKFSSGAPNQPPLDMSEEAINERWFRRAAQIKDISELSQIPDEDFPPIMPMLKGVNRFVVSKRKTPLERRLTSQQYKRNLPIVSSESVKKESDSN